MILLRIDSKTEFDSAERGRLLWPQPLTYFLISELVTSSSAQVNVGFSIDLDQMNAQGMPTAHRDSLEHPSIRGMNEGPKLGSRRPFVQ
jgi:hypothetical protein